MLEGVVAELKAVAREFRDHIRIACNTLSDDKERGRNTQSDQGGGDSGGPGRVGSIVEGECDPPMHGSLDRNEALAIHPPERSRAMQRAIASGRRRHGAAT